MKDACTAVHGLDQVFMQRVREKKARELADDFYAEDAEVLPPTSPGSSAG